MHSQEWINAVLAWDRQLRENKQMTPALGASLWQAFAELCFCRHWDSRPTDRSKLGG